MTTKKKEIGKCHQVSSASLYEAQWKLIGLWRQWFTEKLATPPRHLDALEEKRFRQLNLLWETQSKILTLDGEFLVFAQRARIEEFSTPPLQVLFLFTNYGFFPPPELLLGLQRAFDNYLNAAGDTTLEQAFFGPLRRRAGNYARRSSPRTEEFAQGFEVAHFAKDLSCGLTAAAEKVILARDLKGKDKERDAESVKKIYRLVKKRLSSDE